MTERRLLSVSRTVTPRLIGLACILAIGLVAITGASLVAAQRDDPGEPPGPAAYHGCVNTYTGVLRIIADGQTCQDHETAIELGASGGDAALLERIEALEEDNASQQSEIASLQQAHTDQQTLIETQQGEIEALQQANTAQQGQIDTLLADVGTLQQDIATMQSTIGTLTQQHADQQLEIDVLEDENGDREQEIATLEGDLGDLSAAHTALQAQVPACLSTAGDEVYFSGCNVNIRSGGGATVAAVNGLGNLIIGYNESNSDTRTGSHNLVIGPFHSYSNYGGLVAGNGNIISGRYSSVSGGIGNTASGDFSSVSGGNDNTASADFSSVSGGLSNTASAFASAVGGGSGQDADANFEFLP